MYWTSLRSYDRVRPRTMPLGLLRYLLNFYFSTTLISTLALALYFLISSTLMNLAAPVLARSCWQEGSCILHQQTTLPASC